MSRASLEGASARAVALSEPCSLVRLTTGEPSRSCHGEGHVRRALFRGQPRRVLPGYGGRHVRTVWSGTGETRLPGLRRAKTAWYKPMVKSCGGQRESEGVVVPVIGVQHNAPGGKGPDFGHAGGEGKREGMAGTARSNHPGGHWPVVAATRLSAGAGESARTPTQAMGCGQAVSGVGVSMPCMTVSTGVTSCGRRGSGCERTGVRPGWIGSPWRAVEEYGVERMLAELAALTSAQGSTARAGAAGGHPEARWRQAAAGHSRRCGTGWPSRRRSWCWSRSSRRTSCRARIGFRPKRSATQAMERLRVGFIEGCQFVVGVRHPRTSSARSTTSGCWSRSGGGCRIGGCSSCCG